MSTGGLVVSLVLLLLAGFWIAGPLLGRESGRASRDESAQKQRDRLLGYYERVLTNIRDLDEDYSTGKMQTGDYEAEREEWVQRGIQVLKALDSIEMKSIPADEAAIDEAVDSEIEAAIAAYRSKAARAE